MIHNIRKIALTDLGIQFIEQFGTPIFAPDFLGYIIRVTKREGCLIGLDNWLLPYSIDKRKPMMTSRRVHRVYKVLTGKGFLKYVYNDVFPEFERYNNIKFDPSKAFRMDNRILDGVVYTPIAHDDNVEELYSLLDTIDKKLYGKINITQNNGGKDEKTVCNE